MHILNDKSMPFYFILFCCLLGHVWGCSGTRPQTSPSDAGSSAAREEFDPYTLNDDDFLLRPTSSTSPTRPTKDTAVAPVKITSKKTEGYRVQLAAVLDRARADLLLKRIPQELQKLADVIYDQDTHLYKIQAGHCQTPVEAERLRDEFKKLGFQEAYVVRTQIVQTPLSPR